jgi:hypothetical protein
MYYDMLVVYRKRIGKHVSAEIGFLETGTLLQNEHSFHGEMEWILRDQLSTECVSVSKKIQQRFPWVR